MMTHARRSRREYRQVGTALPLDPQLAARDRFADFIVAHGGARRRRFLAGMRFDLLLTPLLMLRRCGRIVTVTVDDHSGLLKVEHKRRRFGSRAADKHPVIGLALFLAEDKIAMIGDSGNHARLATAAHALK